jgi:hypothetical protein
VFGVLLLGIFQAILFYRAKAVVDYAALQAARSGAVHFAEKSAMQDGMLRGLLPLYAHEPGKAEIFEAYAKAKVDLLTGAANIDIISPTQRAFDDWKEKQFDGVEAIPNDSLPFRGDAVGGSGLTVQDANVLKIRVTYKYPLIVPVIDRMIGTLDPARSLAKGHKVYSLSIESQAIVRMQTPIRDRNLLADASGGGGSGPGSGPGPGSGSGGTDPAGPGDMPPGGGGGNDGGDVGDGGNPPGGDDGGDEGGDVGEHPPCTAG